MKNFQATTVPLQGYNLIEASAGTGKTYSIAILVLRLILEQKRSIDKILIVTFTKAAVAELQVRIRKFLYEAYYAAGGNTNIDPTVFQLVDHAKTLFPEEDIALLLYDNITLLDEAKIMTIHGFCQNIIKENSFESNQVFGATFRTDIDDITTQYVNDFWRKNITTLNITYLSALDYQSLRANLLEVVKKSLDGLPLLVPTMIYDQWDKIFNAFDNGTLNNEQLLEQVLIYGSYQIVQNIINHKKNMGILTYDDLINDVYQAINGPYAESLIHNIRSQYDVVFIDEFQDTDHKQYTIFKAIFNHEDHITFMIGDPKQSIYAFRQADINTYFKARKDAGENVYTMNTNYRSTPLIIEALNILLLPKPDFDTFHFGKSTDSIVYHPVEAGLKNTPKLYQNNVPASAISVYQFAVKEERIQKIANDIATLINNPAHYFLKDGEKRMIKPADIGILVRGNKTGVAIQQQLSKKGVPAIMVNDNTIFNSRSATSYLYLLEACLNPQIKTINKVLTSNLSPYSLDEILCLDEEFLLLLFTEWRKTWDEKGLHALINRFLSDINFNEHIKKDSSNDSVRLYVDLLQLTELLHKMQLQKSLTQEDIVYHLKQGILGNLPKDDTHQLRIESDEEAVQIATIHKSKGLEYPIVFIADVDADRPNDKNFTKSFYSKDHQSYFSLIPMYWDAYKDQLETEHERDARRLIYVAFTRAKYKIFTYSKTAFNKTMPKKGGGIFLKHLLINKNLPEGIIDENIELSGHQLKAKIDVAKDIAPFRHTPNITLDQTWTVMSYTRFSGSHYTTPKLSIGTNTEPYDTFIFESIGKGAQLGTRMHSLLEVLDFSDNKLWSKKIAKSLNIILTKDHALDKKQEQLINDYLTLIHHLANATIHTKDSALQLKLINNKKILHELEFYFPLREAQAKLIVDFMEAYDLGHVSEQLYPVIKGYMTGLIDMVFESYGKYYILDWKTNFLGNRLEDYSQENIEQAMLEHNYHLQYIIYSLALKKYLAERIPNFNYERDFGGVIYVFIRGVRAGNEFNNGVYYNCPSEEQISIFEKIMS